MTERQFKKELKKAVAYGLGYMCGKHNLLLSQKEVKRISTQYLEGERKLPEGWNLTDGYKSYKINL